MTNWETHGYNVESLYENIDYYGAVLADFESCSFTNISFYWNFFDCVDFKNCTFMNCTFLDVRFEESCFVNCCFKNCHFHNTDDDSHCSAKKSYIIDSEIDNVSLNNNPLLIQLSSDTTLLTPAIKKEVYSVFFMQRPEKAVDDEGHCLSCYETQETHLELFLLEDVSVESFNLCAMSIESFSEDALLYYMPRLLELLLIGKENEWNFIEMLLKQLVPNTFGDRFKSYRKVQIKLIIKVLELFYNKYNTEEERWDYALEMMADKSMYAERLEYCEAVLEFWKRKGK